MKISVGMRTKTAAVILAVLLALGATAVLSAGQMRASAAGSVYARVSNDVDATGGIWGSTLVASAPEGKTGMSLSALTVNGFTTNFTVPADISSLDASKRVMRFWFYRPSINQYLAQMNLSGAQFVGTANCGGDSTSNPLNAAIGSLTGWLQLQIPLTGVTNTTVTSFWLFVGNPTGSAAATATTDTLLYSEFEFCEADDPTAKLLYPSVATGFTLNKTEMALSPDRPTDTLSATLTPAGSSGSVLYSSNNTDVATVAANGTVTAKNNGTATITATLNEDNSVTQTCTVTVSGFSNVASIEIQEGATLGLSAESKEAQLHAVLKDAGGNAITDVTPTWSVSGKAVIVDGDGKVTAVKTGTATVTAAVSETMKASVTVNVTGMDFAVKPQLSDPTSWAFPSEPSTIVPSGTGIQQSVTFCPGAGGVLTANFAENADLSVMDLDKAVMEFWLYLPNKNVKLNPLSVLAPGDYYLDDGKKLEALKTSSMVIGWNKIRVPFKGWIEASYDINNITAAKSVYFFAAPVDGLLFADLTFREAENDGTMSVLDTRTVYTALTLNETALSLSADSTTATLSATPTGDMGTIRFRTKTDADKAFVEVDAVTGEITALANGTATVQAYVAENEAVTAECTVTVSGFIVIDSVTIGGDKNRTVNSKDPVTLTASVKDEDGSDIPTDKYTLAWSVDNKDVGKVNNAGEVTFFRNGTLTVTARAGEKSDTVTFTVSGISNRIDLTVESWYWTLSESDMKPNGYEGTMYSLDGQLSGRGYTATVKEEYLDGLLNDHAAIYFWIYLPSTDCISSFDGVSYHDGNDTQIYINATGNEFLASADKVAGWNLVRLPLGDIQGKSITKFWLLMNGTLDGILISTPWLDEVLDGECTTAILETQTLYTGITVTETLTLTKTDGTATLTPVGTGGDCGTFRFESSDENIAAVNALTGAVTAKGNGEATITVYLLENGAVKTTCAVSVSGMPVVTSITVKGETTLNLKIDDIYAIEVTVLEEGATYSLSYETSDAEVALVNKEGRLIAVGAGSAVITVKVAGTDIKATLTVTVKGADEGKKDPANTGCNGCGGNVGGTGVLGAALLLIVFAGAMMLKKRGKCSK